MDKNLRFFFAAGPVDAVSVYHYWVQDEDDPSHVSVTYAGQFLDVCREFNAQGYILSSCAGKKRVQDGSFTIEHRPIPFERRSTPWYQLGQLGYGLRLIWTILRFRANVAVVMQGRTYWFLLSVLPWLGVQVIPTIHCVLWRKYVPPTHTQNLILQASRRFFTRSCAAVLAVSEDIAAQVKQLTQGQHKPVFTFLPTYRRAQFADIGEPDATRSPFRVLFVGRIVANKGIYILLDLAKRLIQEGRTDIVFDLCGRGADLEKLRRATEVAGIGERFVCQGYCDRDQIRQMFQRSHVVIVPTTQDFIEGLNKVVLEGVLSGRPVVTSAVCPALSLVRAAVVEVPPDNVEAYKKVILNLCDDLKFYEEKRRGCLTLQEQFYDPSKSWGTQLKTILLEM